MGPVPTWRYKYIDPSGRGNISATVSQDRCIIMSSFEIDYVQQPKFGIEASK
jgi:hypothetical protein